jgi:hypothetical protein
MNHLNDLKAAGITNPDLQLATFSLKEAGASLPDYIKALKRPREWGVYEDILHLWVEVEQLTAGTKANRLQLGERFRKLRDIYSDRNIGGNRRTSGHGTFEKECLQRGYQPRTVRDLIADYEACISGKPSAAEKRKDRQARRKQTTPLNTLSHVERAAQGLVENPQEIESLSPEELQSCDAEAKKAIATIQAVLGVIANVKIRFLLPSENGQLSAGRVQ